jgi:hypothetical protein
MQRSGIPNEANFGGGLKSPISILVFIKHAIKVLGQYGNGVL